MKAEWPEVAAARLHNPVNVEVVGNLPNLLRREGMGKLADLTMRIQDPFLMCTLKGQEFAVPLANVASVVFVKKNEKNS